MLNNSFIKNFLCKVVAKIFLAKICTKVRSREYFEPGVLMNKIYNRSVKLRMNFSNRLKFDYNFVLLTTASSSLFQFCS